MKLDERVSGIEIACARFNRTEATKLATNLAKQIREERGPYPAPSAITALKALLRKRWFSAALTLGEAVLESGQSADGVRLRYAQALIDSGRLNAALPYLQTILASVTRGSFAESEVRGLIGRVYKQLYVNGAGEGELRGDRLLRAYNAYFDAYKENPNLRWHGINAVALYARAKRDKVRLDVIPPNAQQLFDEASAENDLWSHAIAGEAAIALKQYDLARTWYEKYAVAKDADAFEIASSLRQLIEVWKLSDTEPPGSDILPIVNAALLQRQGGALELQGNDVSVQLEKTFGKDGAQSLGWYRQGLKRCLSVCCVRNAVGDPWGTGFIVRGSDFGRGEELLLLTNEHVLSATHNRALRAGNAQATFETAPERVGVKCAEIVWSDRTLDATLARFDATLVGIDPIELDPTTELPDRDDTSRVYVIGHPLGGRLSFSLNDNLLLDYDDARMHYRAPTQPGSSGSPVFDDQWRLVALHHGGGSEMPCLNGKDDVYEANEGFRIDTIRTAAGGA
jgi:tetratricopeptide (TPR) repeat protein